MWNGCRKEGLILNPATFQRMCSKKEIYGSIILVYCCLIKRAWQNLGEDRRLGDCHRGISSMVSPYRCTVKACNKVMDVAGVSHKQVRHSYSYYMITYLYFWCSRWIMTHTVIDTTCTQNWKCSDLTNATRSFYSFFLESTSGSRVWTLSAKHCSGKQSILYLKWASDFSSCNSCVLGIVSKWILENFAVLDNSSVPSMLWFGIYKHAHAYTTLRTIGLYTQLWHSTNKTESMQTNCWSSILQIHSYY